MPVDFLNSIVKASRALLAEQTPPKRKPGKRARPPTTPRAGCLVWLGLSSLEREFLSGPNIVSTFLPLGSLKPDEEAGGRGNA